MSPSHIYKSVSFMMLQKKEKKKKVVCFQEQFDAWAILEQYLSVDSPVISQNIPISRPIFFKINWCLDFIVDNMFREFHFPSFNRFWVIVVTKSITYTHTQTFLVVGEHYMENLEKLRNSKKWRNRILLWMQSFSYVYSIRAKAKKRKYNKTS